MYYLRNVQNVHQKFTHAIIGGASIIIPKVVHYEIQRGFRIQHAPKKEILYNELVGETGFCSIDEMDTFCWERAERIYDELYRKGFTVGELDILIAAACLEHNQTLVTNNTRDFTNIDGLYLVDWTI
ncbi:MAG: PIN domain-containing protein [Synergistaceae bacterium]|nr:PIN domain-containing protein [Synergistaceae bacterium]